MNLDLRIRTGVDLSKKPLTIKVQDSEYLQQAHASCYQTVMAIQPFEIQIQGHTRFAPWRRYIVHCAAIDILRNNLENKT